MSVVVAIKQGDQIYMGSDSQTTRGGTRTTLKNPNNYKIWKVKNAPNCIMGHVGLLRDSNIVRLMDNLVNDYNVFMKQINYEFVVKKIVPDIIDELKHYGYLSENQYFETLESRFLFAFRDQLYLIGSDGAVIEIDDYVAIGSGEDQAIGSLLSTEGQDPETRIIKAIKASATTDIYVDYPIVLSNTKNTNFIAISKTEEQNFIINKQKRR